MSLLAFTTNNTDLSLAYHGHHTGMLVLLSLLIAFLAAYTSFSHRHLMQQAVSALSYRLWLSSGSVAMGLAIASMHYVAMHATVFLPAGQLHALGGIVMSKQTLGTLAVVVAVAILLLSTITVLMRRRVAPRISRSEQQRQSTLVVG